jgi:hypothetical protein
MPRRNFIMANKAGIERIAVDRYVISSAMVKSYLEDQLGFNIGCDFTRWTGVTANHSYVRMRVVIGAKDLLADSTLSQNFAIRTLQENAVGMQFKDTTMAVLEKYMYPKNMETMAVSQENLAEMYKYGLYGDRLAEVAKLSKLTLAPQANMFRLYLRPELIIRDMLSDVETNKIDGTMEITGVFGMDSDTIRWEVEISKGGMTNTETGVLSIDKIFNA